MQSAFFLAVLCALLAPSMQQVEEENTRPVFTNDLYNVLTVVGINENTPIGAYIGTLVCIDAEGDDVYYFVDDSTVFDVDPFNGDVTLQRELNREDLQSTLDGQKAINVRFSCTDADSDGLLYDGTYANIEVKVLDYNDNFPVFVDILDDYVFSVWENDTVGTVLDKTISVTDADQSLNAQIFVMELRCTESDTAPCELFRVVPTEVAEGQYTARIVLEGALDFEARREYRTQLIAVDGDSTSEVRNTASTGVLIRVRDFQDTDPVFTNREFIFDVLEGTPADTVISLLSLSARDGDTGSRPMREVRLEILAAPDGGVNLFRTGPSFLASDIDTGIYTANVIANIDIDREQEGIGNVYTFRAKATELDNGTLTSDTGTATFTVNIQDINDNAPLFTQDNYLVSVAEMGQSSGSVQIPNLRIEVTDADESSNARYRVEIVSQTNPGAFRISPNTTVTGTQIFGLAVNNFQFLDYDEPQYRQQILTLRTVEILANGQQGSQTDTATVTVALTDSNDNTPVFVSETWQGSISENAADGTPVVTVTATDLDSGSNGVVLYSIENRITSVFNIDTNNGTIFKAGSLDYETKNEYTFIVFAFDSGLTPRTSQAVVRITVTDYNDVGPRFLLTSYTARVTESSLVFESPVQVQAIDPADPTAMITYRIVSGNTPSNSFVLNSTTGVLSLRRAVSYEDTPGRSGIIILVVEASDNGSPPLTQSTVITVTVIDENDNVPIFNPTTYSTTISEAIAPATYLLQVYATDADFGSNGEIRYRIGGGGRDNFAVNSTGAFFVSNLPRLDYDAFRQYVVQVIAIDGGSPQRTATASVSVTITDANNKNPYFLDDFYSARVNDSDPIGTEVLTVSAVDPDSSSTIRYSIDANSIVAVNDRGAQVFTTDVDTTNAFAVNPTTGVITVNGRLNSQIVEEMAFVVIAEDVDASALGRQQGSTRVTIAITGRPDLQLFFNLPWTKDVPVYQVPVLESALVGTEIIPLQARDPLDASVVGTYVEVPGSDPDNYFELVTRSTRGGTAGVVVLAKKLDFESEQRTHSVVVEAIQPAIGSVPQRISTATIVVQVQDFNDNRPEFTQSLYRFTVVEDLPRNGAVGIVAASDVDSATFGPIEFSLGGAVGTEDFYLSPITDTGSTLQSAQLRIRSGLDYERTRFYSLYVLATDNMAADGSSIKLTSTAVVEIVVRDINDNVPFFIDLSREFSVAETASPSSRLGQIRAIDNDFGRNGQITYSLQEDPSSFSGIPGLQLFAISEYSGVLFTRRELIGLTGTYRLRVVAQDRGSPPLSSSIPVTIKVQGAQDDDGTPQWMQPINNYVVRVNENNITKLDVQFIAKARTNNASVVYSLVPYNSDYMKFRINNNGEVFVTELLDREDQPEYTLVIQAMDAINTTLLSRRTLIVELIDEDDNQASFTRSDYAACPNDFEAPTIFYATDKTPPGVIAARAVACDPDGPGNNEIYYYRYTDSDLCMENNFGAFSVLINGSIVTSITLAYERQAEYLVCVRASSVPLNLERRKRAFDTSQMSNRQTVGYVVIRINDINDNGPSFPADQAVAVLETLPGEDTVTQVYATDADGPLNNQVRYSIVETIYYPPNRDPYPMRGAFAINPSSGVITSNLPSYEDFAQGYYEITVAAFDVKNQLLNDTMTVTVVVYQKSQLLRVVLNKPPSQGLQLAEQLISRLNEVGQPEKQFFFKTASEHRTASKVDLTRTDICFVVVENKKAMQAFTGIGVLDSDEFKDVLNRDEFDSVDRGTCYPLTSSQKDVKWQDLWWVLVAIAIFIFVCVLILIITICILYDRYKTYMNTQTTYLVPQ